MRARVECKAYGQGAFRPPRSFSFLSHTNSKDPLQKLYAREGGICATTGGVMVRWWIAALIFLATLINFVNRLIVAVLGPVITAQLGLTNSQFASLTTVFLAAYTLSQGLSGKLYDRIGTKRGFVVSIVVWSLASMAHAFARGLWS